MARQHPGLGDRVMKYNLEGIAHIKQAPSPEVEKLLQLIG